MKVLIVISAIVFSVVFVFPYKGYAQETGAISVWTSEFPPYNYTDNNGTVVGLSTEVVQAVLHEMKITALPISMPWARAYKYTQLQENVLLHSITRTKAREKLFKWVGVIAPANYSLWALKARTDIVIRNLEDAKPYSIGTTNNDVVEQYLTAHEFQYLYRMSGQDAYSNNIKKLIKGRIDLWGVASIPGYYFLEQENQHDHVKQVFVLEDLTDEGMYMAFGPKTSDVVVEQFRNALEQIKEKGIYQKILKKYLK
ncbi:substrate-binding periplasmic protein [Neptuniibacter sp. QD29_5]|uniref:substrate-binding periplasmic protein n=1 Tax=Neptuniibacter sp. QD29_5 TaxID=3398207 RepID=UPI0039F551E7